MKSPLVCNISRYILAALFLFSGFAKGVNTFGLSIQIGDYFSALGLSFLRELSVAVAIALPAVEFLLGIILAAGIFRRVAAWSAMLFMSFFTLLTLWIAIYNPVKDCGCFGDLFVISNWATFFKNIAFMIPTLIVFRSRGGADRRNYPALVLFAVASFVIPVHSYCSLPIIDATPYKIGANIPSLMSGGTADEGHTTLIYRNRATSDLHRFEIEDTTWQDDTQWEFVDSETTIKKRGYTPPINALSMIDTAGVDRTAKILARPGRTLLFIIPTPEELTTDELNLIDRKTQTHREAGDSVAMLYSSVIEPPITEIELFTVDQTTLRTMIQHHRGGAMLIRGGTIEGKWPLSALP